MQHLRRIWRADLPWLLRLDQSAYLLQPFLQALIGIAFAVSIVLVVLDVASFWGDGGWWQLAFFFVLGYGGVVLGCIARGARAGQGGILRSLLIVPLYAAYSWLIWPVLARGSAS